ncbi:CG14718 [Drosophila busckii]|uniref:CG14718 n=2 Tax=Drosophila busckii TaxID=30019 RepID=A0A0M5J9V7_DROBS|nr:CG14718 [Drosophila busckii]
MYRFENGGGDARGSLLLDEEYCSTYNNDGVDATMGAEQNLAAPAAPSFLQMNDRNADDLFTAITGHSQSDCPWSSYFGVAKPVPSLKYGEETFVLRPDTVFVLGMRLNVTKNDITLFFGKMGNIKIDEISMKPKIFVYKNKLTGRSKGEATITYTSPQAATAAINYLNGSRFLGHLISVVPAYLSTRPGNSVRYCYAQESGAEQQRRQRQKKWKPAVDNWLCKICHNSNFVWRSDCNRCKVNKKDAMTPKESLRSHWRPWKNDWTCSYCLNVNFWYRQNCNRCCAPQSDPSPSSNSDKDKWELVVSNTSMV